MAYYLAARLCKIGMHVKIIEKDENRCEELCDCLPKVTVIHGDATDHDLLSEEGVENVDAFVALTGIDEENIILSLYAKSQGAGKIIAKVNEDRRARMGSGFRYRQYRFGENGNGRCDFKLRQSEKELPKERKCRDDVPTCGRKSRSIGVHCEK